MKKVILLIIMILVVIQFITIDKNNPSVNSSNEFMTIMKPPPNVKNMLKNSCYDCHSYETVYPWYSNIAPVSWLIGEHVRNGRRHLNFSVWNEYKGAKKDTKLEECIEMIESGEMPMKGYVLIHSNADLIPSEKKKLIDWFSSKRNEQKIR